MPYYKKKLKYYFYYIDDYIKANKDPAIKPCQSINY